MRLGNNEKKELGAFVIKQLKELRPDLTNADIQKVASNLYQTIRKERKDGQKIK